MNKPNNDISLVNKAKGNDSGRR